MRSCNAHPRCRHHLSANADAAHWCFWEAAANRVERSALSRRNQSCCKSAWVRVKGRTKWPVCGGGEAAAAKWTHAGTGGGGWIFNSTQFKSVDHSLLQFRNLQKTLNQERTCCADAEKMTRLLDWLYLSGWDAVATLNRPSVRKALPHRGPRRVFNVCTSPRSILWSDMTEISEKENEPQNLHRPQATVPSQPESKVAWQRTCVALPVVFPHF